jgi:hypothetical protein
MINKIKNNINPPKKNKLTDNNDIGKKSVIIHNNDTSIINPFIGVNLSEPKVSNKPLK